MADAKDINGSVRNSGKFVTLLTPISMLKL